MNRLQKIIFGCFSLTIFIPGLAHTACMGSSPSWTSTPDYQSVASCVSQATAGDTINVLAGSGSVTWPASAVSIPANKPLNLVGPGRENLTIIFGGSNVLRVGPYVGTAELPATRITGFKFLSATTDAKYVAITVQGQGWRIDHCSYESVDSAGATTAGVFVIASGFNTTIQPYGLIDNNIVVNGKVLNNGMGNFNNIAAAWSDNLNLGTNEAIYVEDNVFSSNTTYRKLVTDANRGGKYVFRYNTTTKSWVLAHGLQADDERATRKWEIYGNTFQTAAGGGRVTVQVKGGTGVIFNNDITSPEDPWVSGIDLYHERDVVHPGVNLAGICDGTSGWDENTPGQGGWLCRDQIGADKDTSQWIGPPQDNLPGPVQTKTPAYFWSIMDGTTIKEATKLLNRAATVVKNRDYYEHTASFNGTSGVGCGPLANRPATCTPGVAYWATNQSCTNMTGMVGANPTTPISGTLYKCTAPNAWTAYYTPYTYPHPLRTGADLPPAPAPSGPLAAGDDGGGGCFIATAAYGSYLDPHVMVLRHFRDNVLLTNKPGRAFVGFYYAHSPAIAQKISEYESLRLATRIVLTPVVYAMVYPLPAIVLLSSILMLLIAIAKRRRKIFHTGTGLPVSDNYFVRGPGSAFARVK